MFTLQNTKLSYVTARKENPSVSDFSTLVRILTVKKKREAETTSDLYLTDWDRWPCPQAATTTAVRSIWKTRWGPTWSSCHLVRCIGNEETGVASTGWLVSDLTSWTTPILRLVRMNHAWERDGRALWKVKRWTVAHFKILFQNSPGKREIGWVFQQVPTARRVTCKGMGYHS